MRTGVLLLILSASLPLFGQARLDIYLHDPQSRQNAQWIIQIFDNPEDFPVHPDKAYKQIIVEAGSPQPVSVELPPGRYAIAAYLDENHNGHIDRNWLGLPAEPYALSGNPKFHFGPPRFDECQILVQAPVTTVRLEVKD